MIQSLVFALMTIAAMAAVAWPLARRPIARRGDEGAGDIAVYRDQIAEIERDREAGLIGGEEAEAARVEVSRRLIAAADAEGANVEIGTQTSRRLRRFAAACSFLVLPIGAVALYLALGSPDLPGEPLGARVAKAHGGDQSVEVLFKKVEAHLGQHPDDGRGWEIIAPVYMRLGRYDDAVRARTNALRLLGATADREADLGEALVAAGNGVVTTQAKEAFDTAIRLDASNVTARFYQGLAAEQDGNRPEAIRLWQALLDAAPAGAQWTRFVRQALVRAESSDGAEASVAGAAQAAPAAPAAQAPGGHDEMIGKMVERLAARLQQDGSDIDGWVRLARSYKALDQPDKMRTAVADARAALAKDPDKLRQLDEDLKALESEPPALPAPLAAPPTATAAMGVPAGETDMVRGMVERLAARLQRDGSDIDGWVRLARSYKVLDQPDKMRTAMADARAALASDPDKLRQLDEGLKALDAATVTAPPAAEREATDANAGGVDPMVTAMVNRLAERLHRDGSDVEGWIQLVRSYKVLGEVNRMRTAASEARRALADDPTKLNRLIEGLKSLGAAQSDAQPDSN